MASDSSYMHYFPPMKPTKIQSWIMDATTASQTDVRTKFDFETCKSTAFDDLHTNILCGNIAEVTQALSGGEMDVNCVFCFTVKSHGGQPHHLSSTELAGEHRNRMLITTTPLHTAVVSKRVQMVKLLLEFGADPNKLDSQRKVPALTVLQHWPKQMPNFTVNMSKAERRYHSNIERQHKVAQAILELLIQKGANINEHVNCREEYLIHLAVKHNLYNALTVLLKHDAHLNVVDKYGSTPLQVASDSGHLEIVDILLKLQTDIDNADNVGNTVIHSLALNDRTPNCKLLDNALRRSSNKCKQNDYGQTALHIASMHGNEAAIHRLIHHGLLPDVQDIHGKTALFDLLDGVCCLEAIYGLELLLQWTVHPKISSTMKAAPAWLAHTTMLPLREKLMPLQSNPPTLKRMARLSVRRAMGMRRITHYHVNKLPCPPGLAELVLYNTPEWWT